MSESPDTQAEAGPCWRGECRTGCYYPDAASCSAVRPRARNRTTRRTGATGATGFGDADGLDCENGCERAPAQDGAEVETLAKAIWDSLPHPAASDEDPAPWKTAGDYRQNQMRVQARSLLASGWLAQRDKDRDAAVAGLNRKFYEEGRAHAAEQIAYRLEALADWHLNAGTKLPVEEMRALATEFRARAAAPAGEQRE